MEKSQLERRFEKRAMEPLLPGLSFLAPRRGAMELMNPSKKKLVPPKPGSLPPKPGLRPPNPYLQKRAEAAQNKTAGVRDGLRSAGEALRGFLGKGGEDTGALLGDFLTRPIKTLEAYKKAPKYLAEGFKDTARYFREAKSPREKLDAWHYLGADVGATTGAVAAPAILGYGAYKGGKALVNKLRGRKKGDKPLKKQAYAGGMRQAWKDADTETQASWDRYHGRITDKQYHALLQPIRQRMLDDGKDTDTSTPEERAYFLRTGDWPKSMRKRLDKEIARDKAKRKLQDAADKKKMQRDVKAEVAAEFKARRPVVTEKTQAQRAAYVQKKLNAMKRKYESEKLPWAQKDTKFYGRSYAGDAKDRFRGEVRSHTRNISGKLVNVRAHKRGEGNGR